VLYTVGGLFSGYGGLELGLEQTGGFEIVWHCEIELYPSAILEERFPGVPNLGDITKVNWNEVKRVDLLCG
jgi:site-specific DNA-cytosine methylase